MGEIGVRESRFSMGDDNNDGCRYSFWMHKWVFLWCLWRDLTSNIAMGPVIIRFALLIETLTFIDQSRGPFLHSQDG